ncbi:hypothetical protein VE03_01137 [Pseudogymnoascus sp. 23342-1-I1]|nr:hypothetical protein VE03_01137 [Pseudogymnoascus sp. 23342-1-I1]
MGDTEFWRRERSYLRRRDGGWWIFTSQSFTDIDDELKKALIEEHSNEQPLQMTRSIARSKNISESGIGIRNCAGGLVCRTMGLARRGAADRLILRSPDMPLSL